MATETVNDYLGHPCEIIKASEQYEEMIASARSKTQRDRREVTRQIGRLLNAIDARLQHMQATPEAVIQLLSSDTDRDAARAVLEMATPYGNSICNQFAELAGFTLLALELGGLTQSQSTEVIQG